MAPQPQKFQNLELGVLENFSPARLANLGATHGLSQPGGGVILYTSMGEVEAQLEAARGHLRCKMSGGALLESCAQDLPLDKSWLAQG